MPKIDITENERILVNDAITKAIASAERAQNAKGRTKTIAAVYEQHERELRQLQDKFAK